MISFILNITYAFIAIGLLLLKNYIVFDTYTDAYFLLILLFLLNIPITTLVLVSGIFNPLNDNFSLVFFIIFSYVQWFVIVPYIIKKVRGKS